MTSLLEPKHLRDAERLMRITMILTMLIAGTSKLCSNGMFHAYYLGLFTRPHLRIQLPAIACDLYLRIIPYIELALGTGLLLTKYRRQVIIAFVLYFMSLEAGHYILEEWLEVDVMIPIIFFGIVAYVLPAHSHWTRRD